MSPEQESTAALATSVSFSPTSWLVLVLLFPLVGSVLSYLVGRKNKNLAGPIASAASIASFIAVVALFFGVTSATGWEQTLWNWFTVPVGSGSNLVVDFTLRMDSLSAVMALVVTGIGSLIHLYSVSYMSEDEGRHRFFAYLNLFMFSMMSLVLGGNLLVLFIGWEGVGLCSYLLIGFWFKNLSYAAAGRKAFVVNRIGDAGFLLGVFILFINFGTIDFLELAQAIAGRPELMVVCTVVAFCMFVGAAGKSAQIPLFVWLPDAMAGPTPVSALIHAATMVTAGVYLMARMNFLFVLAPIALILICFIAAATAFVAATTALTQNDIKKVLAYSTVSQLGFMFLAAAAGAFWVAIFHVITHAFFKACLFLGAGSVIHGCHHEQDMRKMGGLWRYMPITAATYGVSVLAIAGIFPFAGYQSKHAILVALGDASYLAPYANAIIFIATVTAVLTAFYMTRSFAMTFLGTYRGHGQEHVHDTVAQSHSTDHVDDAPHAVDPAVHNLAVHHHSSHQPHESPLLMTAPLIVLALLATIGGLFLETRLPEFLSVVVPGSHAHAGESIIASLMHSWTGLLGVVVALLLYTQMSWLPGKVYSAFSPLSKLFDRKWYFDEVYHALIVGPLETISKLLWKVVDQGLIDGTVNGTGSVLEITGEVGRISQTGHLRHYALFMFLAAIFMIVFLLVL